MICYNIASRIYLKGNMACPNYYTSLNFLTLVSQMKKTAEAGDRKLPISKAEIHAPKASRHADGGALSNRP